MVLLLVVIFVVYVCGIIDKVDIKGLDKGDDVVIIENIQELLLLYDMIGKEQGELCLEYLLLQVEWQICQVLELFGYYNLVIKVEVLCEDEYVCVLIYVDKGVLVIVCCEYIDIIGLVMYDQYLQDDLVVFKFCKGQCFEYIQYEVSKIIIIWCLVECGYFDVDYIQCQVQIICVDNVVDIDLIWDSGCCYNMGLVCFEQDYFVDKLFDLLVYWDQGSYYYEGKLDWLCELLIKLDYFSVIDIQLCLDQVDENGEVLVDVKLIWVKCIIYIVGLSYGSESGLGVCGGIEWWFLNNRGYKMNMQLDYVQKCKSLVISYCILVFNWFDGWYIFVVSVYDEQIDYIDLCNFKLIVSCSGEINEYWIVIVLINVLCECWCYVFGIEFIDVVYNILMLVYLQMVVDYVNVDDEMFLCKGISGVVMVCVGVEGVGLDISFVQVNVVLCWYILVGESNCFILCGEGGIMWISDLVVMLLSLCYFVGGDCSIRGYVYCEVGLCMLKLDKYVLGVKNLVIGLVEYEYYFNGGFWGVVVFVDIGSVFDNIIDLYIGVGFGVCWKLLVGLVCIDVVYGLNNLDLQFQLYLNIGVDL